MDYDKRPKKPLTPYFKWRSDNYIRIVSENKEATQARLKKIFAKAWVEYPDKSKLEEEYNKEMDNYKRLKNLWNEQNVNTDNDEEIKIRNIALHSNIETEAFASKKMKKLSTEYQEISQLKKTLIFYFKDTEQKLVVYQGTPANEITSTLKAILGISENKKLVYLDDDGSPLVLSSSIPNQTKIFVSIGDMVTHTIQNSVRRIAPSLETKKWKWSRSASNAEFKNDLTFTTFSAKATEVYGEILISHGKHYWKIMISELYCCHDFGICDGKLDSDFETTLNTPSPGVIGWAKFFSGEKTDPKNGTFPSDDKVLNFILGVYVDMEKKICLILNDSEKRVYVKERIPFDNVVPFYKSKKHPTDVTLLETGRDAPDWMLKHCIF